MIFYNEVIKKKRLKINKILKDFVNLDNSYIPKKIKDLESDGNVLIEFSDGTSLVFVGVTENNSLQLFDLENLYSIDSYRFMDISSNSYIKKIINKTITNIVIESYNNLPYSIMFYFENHFSLSISYEIQTEFDFDTTVIRFYEASTMQN